MNNLNKIREKMNKLLDLSSLTLENFDLSSLDFFFDDIEKKIIKFEKALVPNDTIEMNFINSRELSITDFEKIFNNLKESLIDINTMRKNCNIDDDGFVVFEKFS